MSDGFVLVLTGGVPDLHFDFEAVDVGDFVDEIETDGHHVVFDEFVFGETEENVGLADSAVADDDDFLENVELFVGLVFTFAHFSLLNFLFNRLSILSVKISDFYRLYCLVLSVME